ncbi:MAG: mechanosensitive ion channel family protein [Thermoanaerobaculia bacterium]
MGLELKEWILPTIFGLFSFIILILVRIFLFKLLQRWAEKTETKIDDIIIDSFKKPSVLWCFALAIHIGISTSNIPQKYGFYLSKIIQIIIIVSVTISIANLLTRILKNYIEETKISLPTSGLFYGILKFTIYLIGFLIILNLIGISITPMITALGVGGLAVALALQDTLSNLFAGIHILVEKTIKIGDLIRLEGGQEGVVEDITWRTTRIRTVSNNLVVIPNRNLAQSIVVNFSMPEKPMVVSIPVNVSYSSDIEKVERVLKEELEKAKEEIEGIFKEKEPVVRFNPGFGENSLNFTIFIYVEEFEKQYLVQSEVRKRIFKRLKEENIEIPFPQRVVHLKEEK